MPAPSSPIPTRRRRPRSSSAAGLNVRQTEALVQRGEQKPAAPKAVDPEVAALERELSTRLGLKVQITQEGRGGNIRIAYRNLDQLDAVLELLRRD